MEYSPGDIIHVNREIGSDRYYFVQGACLGAEDQRDVVAVSFADEQSLPVCEDKNGEAVNREVLHVPVAIFEAALNEKHVTVYDRFDQMPNPVYQAE